MNRTALISGLVFVALGFIFLLERLSLIDVSAGFVLPVLLIGVGMGIVLGARGPRPAPAAPAAPAAPPEKPAEPTE